MSTISSYYAHYYQITNKLYIEIVSKKRYTAETLLLIPHRMMEDMIIVYQVMLEEDESGMKTILMTNEDVKSYNITEEQLYADASENSVRIRPIKISTMSGVMDQIAPEFEYQITEEDEQIFVASVPNKIHGASVIAYPDFMEIASQKLHGSFYILPSSIHEVLLVKDNNSLSAEDLSEMVKEVNLTQVIPSERLSDSVYYYDATSKTFMKL